MTAVEQTLQHDPLHASASRRRDVTPPVGIYSRSWGAATHDVAEGVHRPLTATAAVFAPLAGDGPTLALVALDVGWFPYGPGRARAPRGDHGATGLGEAELLDPAVAHACRREHELAARGQARRGADRAVPRSAHGRGRRRRGRGAIGGATEAFVTYGRAAAASPRTGTSGTPTRSATRAATTRTARRTTRCWSPAPPTATAGRSRRSSTTPATRPRSRGRTGCSRPTTSARPARCWRARSTRLRSSSRAPRASSRRATTTSATRPSPTGTGASWATPPRPRSRRSHRRHALRLHGDRRVRREPRHVGVPALRARAARRGGPTRGGRHRRRPRAQGGHRGRREPLELRPRLAAGA